MELNREKIVIEIAGHIKALKANKGWWENRGRGGWFNHDILEDALALINEITEENKSLGAEKEHLELVVEGKLKRTSALEKQVLALTEENERLRKDNERYAELEQGWIVTGVKKVKADTVRKMQERIAEHATNGYPRKVRLDVVDQIAKEMLEGTK